jgi:hypothetical protein
MISVNDSHCGCVAPSVKWTHLRGSIVPVKLASHPTDETRGDANPHECRDCDAGSSRHFRIGENHNGSVVRELAALGLGYKPLRIGSGGQGYW